METEDTPKSTPPVLWMHKGCGQWCKKIKGRLYYLGKNYADAVERFKSIALQNVDESTESSGLQGYFNYRIAEMRKQSRFDNVYPIFWESKEYMKDDRSEAVDESIRIWECEMHDRLSKWDFNRRVYVITDGQFVKIGSAKCVSSRVASLQTASPRQLNLMLDLPGGSWHERQLHEWFGEYKVRRYGEWFTLSSEVAIWIEQSQILARSTVDAVKYAAKVRLRKDRYCAGVGHTTASENAAKTKPKNHE